MSQPPYQGRGGRGGRGGSMPQQQQPPYYPAAPRPMGAWQPAAPTSMNMQAQQQPPFAQPTPLQAQQQQQQQQPPVSAAAVVAGRAPSMQQQQQPYANQAAYYNPYATYNPYYAAASQQQQQQQGGSNRGAQQQQQPYYHPGPRGAGGPVFYPPMQQQQQSPAALSATTTTTGTGTPVFQPPTPKKKLLVITDKDGNVVDLGALTTKNKAASTPTPVTPAPAVADVPPPVVDAKGAATTLAAATTTTEPVAAVTPATPAATAAATTVSSSNAGAMMRQLAQERLTGKPSTATESSSQRKTEEAIKKVDVAKSPEAPKPAATTVSSKPVVSLADRMAAVRLDDEKPVDTGSKRIIYTKQQFLSFKDKFTARPDTLPDLTIIKGAARAGKSGGGGGGGGGNRNDRGDNSNKGGDWSRGSAPPRRDSNNQPKEPNQWSRGHAPPPQQQNKQASGGRGGKGGQRGGNQNGPPFYDGPVEPLIKSENHWRPKKNTSVFVVAEKQVMSVLNKMTKEKFAKLAEVMVQIPVTSSEILTMMIDRVYDKAIDEPTFGDMYADLCVRLSHSAKVSNYVHIIESDEEPPTEGDAESARGDSTSNTVYRWSNDVSTTDSEIVGPFDSIDACWDVALSEEEETPCERDDLELEIVQVAIRRGIFVKIMKKKESEEEVFYTVYFPVHEAAECGQQMSEIFLSEVECMSDANKKNSFKRSLLNKCQEEFNKQDRYDILKEEMKAYEQNKASMTEAERAETAEELKFRRIRIKKQMLGNIKFIGQLYKKRLLKEKIMRFCIAHMLKLTLVGDENSKTPEYEDSGETDIDEEDHEALCSIFSTIGATIDTSSAVDFMNVCFTKIEELTESKSLPSRSKFMYKDLLDLRQNRWIPRRKEEKAKTLEEIRKDVEREERRQAQLSAQGGRSGYSGGGGGSGARWDGGKGGDRDRRSVPSAPTIRTRPKPPQETDDDGFTKIGATKPVTKVTPKSIQTRPNGSTPAASLPARSSFAALAPEDTIQDRTSPKAAAEPLDQEQLERRIKSMPIDFMNDNGDVDELLLSYDEIAATPDAAITMVQKCMDRLCDCKDDERQAIIQVLTTLYDKGKLSSSDVQNGLAENIEFIDSIVMDAPKAYEYYGDIISELLEFKALDISWLASQLEKVAPEAKAPERTFKETLLRYSQKQGSEAAKTLVQGSEQLLSDLMGKAAWDAISEAM